MAQQSFIFMLNSKVNKELKHTENGSDIGANRGFDWSNDSYLFMQLL